jgi:ketosteroid isomerase-like protein
MDTVATTQTNDLKTLERLNADFIAAVAASDAAWFEQHLAPDFLNTAGDGSLADRKAFIAQVSRPLPLADFRCEDVLIRILGEVAIIHARTAYRKPGGEAGAGRYTDIWAQRQGRWLCVGAQVMRG